MSDVITINTADAVSEQPTQIKTFDLVPADWPFLYKEVPEFDFTKPPVDPNEFASSLVETCKKFNGLGLSANQCGFHHRVFVMGSGDNYVACFNPKIILAEEEAHLPEGCLSFPGKIVSSSMSRSLKVPSKLGKRNDEDEKRLTLNVKIGKQKVFFFHTCIQKQIHFIA